MGVGERGDIERYLESLSKIVLGLRTEDFSLLHDVVRICSEMGLTLYILDQGENSDKRFDCLIIERGSEPPGDGIDTRNVSEILDDPQATVDRAVAVSLGRSKPKKMLVGVDPGKRPGMAFLLDGRLVKIFRAARDAEVAKRISVGRRAYQPTRSLARIGNGAPGSRDRILSLLGEMELPMELVDERMTTTSRKYRDESAAVLIAQTKGVPI